MRERAQQRRYRGATWQQELLLKAALREGPVSLAAWEQWRAHVDPEQLDYDSHRLLPLLYSVLQRQGISDSQMGRFKGVYRRTWYDNTLRLRAAAAVLQALHDEGISTMLLKGAALTLRYYRDVGLRPMDDFDVLVPTHQGLAAIEVLKGLGWIPLFEPVGVTEAEALEIGHAYPFRNARRQEVDLHWHVYYQRVAPTADSELWAAAHPFALSGAPTHILAPADQLLHVCVHGTQRAWWSEERAPNLRWVADAMMILRNAPEALDWNRLSAQAERLRFVLPLREALGYLHDHFEAPIPASVLARIRTMPVPLAERIAERARTSPPMLWGPWVALGVRYLEYCSSLPPDVGVFRRLAGLPAFFRRRWGSAPLWHLPFAAVFRGLRRIRWAAEEHRSPRAGMSTPNTGL
jgi:hypothetical protein